MEPRRTRSRAARSRPREEVAHTIPDQPRQFTLWCLNEDTDDSGEVVHRYKPDRSFCNVSISLQLASAKHNPWIPKAARWKELQRSFPGFLKTSNPTQDTHQSLLTSLIATASDEKEEHGAIRGWDQVRKHLEYRDLHREFELDPTRDLLVIILMDTGFPYKSSITEQYDKIEEYLRVINSGRTIVYPSREERTASEYKVQDIHALDTIAEAQNTWRPVTCFGVGECTLVGTKDIVKRAWSCASVHTITDGTHSSKLTCGQSRRQKVCVKNKQTMVADIDEDREEVWFHQEYVKPLASEELRVFIATRPDPRGARGLLGEVLRVCHTISEEKDDIVATEAMEGTYASLGTTKDAVHNFALGVFEALRDPEFGWFGRFESLEVGCRLDISVNEVGGTLFVNEITRWNGAHYFSDFCTGAPHALMCNAYATAMGRYVGALGK
ncbi:hypothetical protein CkaCkLH20_13262 [Colletotrichum karsti]|uniref:Uncharacterized protein n=1 Tax=Colletotrichum karsti TaxID=1095194 RepID=A0A9P6HSL3_9PEZI|nr:uncharacterized protein CkaCkLH20_13262 [Colletotrichum karsti]KAF9869274.1 hypothetical protein CkaCkLH20_13262 [Colletotrichum karsti]